MYIHNVWLERRENPDLSLRRICWAINKEASNTNFITSLALQGERSKRWATAAVSGYPSWPFSVEFDRLDPTTHWVTIALVKSLK